MVHFASYCRRAFAKTRSGTMLSQAWLSKIKNIFFEPNNAYYSKNRKSIIILWGAPFFQNQMKFEVFKASLFYVLKLMRTKPQRLLYKKWRHQTQVHVPNFNTYLSSSKEIVS